MPSEGAGGWGPGAGNTPADRSTLRAPSPEPQTPATIAALTERELIARIRRALPPAPAWMLVGVGDDAAVVEPERNRVEVLSVDTVVEGVHFDRAFVPADAIGHRALAVNLSDLAAMGAAPRLALVAMALPASLPLADFDGIVSGLTALASHHRLHIAGGNLTRSPGPLVIDVTVVGTVKRRQALTRGGARPGDHLYVSGTIGGAAAGLALLREASAASAVACPKSQAPSQPPIASPPSPSGPGTALGLGTWDLRLVHSYLFPDPRVRLGTLLSRNRVASACMDLSDGLADGVHQIAEASGVGIAIDGDALPIDPAARAWFGARVAGDAGAIIATAMTAGDDYELLVAVRPRMRRRLEAIVRQSGVALTSIGSCIAGGAVTVRRGGHAAQPVPPGYSHFR